MILIKLIAFRQFCSRKSTTHGAIPSIVKKTTILSQFKNKHRKSEIYCEFIFVPSPRRLLVISEINSTNNCYAASMILRRCINLISNENEDCSIGIISSFVFASGVNEAQFLNLKIIFMRFQSSDWIGSKTSLIILLLYFAHVSIDSVEQKEKSIYLLIFDYIETKTSYFVKNAYSICLMSSEIKSATINGSCGQRMYHFWFRRTNRHINHPIEHRIIQT